MLTGYQVETIAVMTENGEFFCLDCWDRNGDYARPVSRYELDEYDTESSYWGFDGEDAAHVDGCSCTNGVYCEGCANDLVEPYADPDCEEKQNGPA